MREIGLVIIGIGLGLTIDLPAMAQRKMISSSEAMGTFKTADGAKTIKVFPVGRGGLDRPGYNLQVEFFTSLKLGRDGNARGNTGQLHGYATIVGDTATFTPDGMADDRCKITMKFTKPGRLAIDQQGSCDFLNDVITTTGSYRKISKTKPVFQQ